MNTNIITEIRDTDFDPQYQMGDISKYNLRDSARGIVMRGDKIALIHVTNLGFHKLPGGGIEAGESIEQAFKREVIEEVGCDCQVLDQVGTIVEYRGQFQLKQISYVMSAKIVGEVGPNKLEPSEIEEGFEVMWVPMEEAIQLIQNDKSDDYESSFIQKRDLTILNLIQSQ